MLSSEFNVHCISNLNKNDIFYSEKIHVSYQFNMSVRYDLYLFTVDKQGSFYDSGSEAFSNRF